MGLEIITEWIYTWGRQRRIVPPKLDYVAVKVVSDNATIPEDAFLFYPWHWCQEDMWAKPAKDRENYPPNTYMPTKVGEIYAVSRYWLEARTTVH